MRRVQTSVSRDEAARAAETALLRGLLVSAINRGDDDAARALLARLARLTRESER